MKKRAAVISFSGIANDQRVMRQVYAVLAAGLVPVVVGFECEAAMPEDLAGVSFRKIESPRRSPMRLVTTAALMAAARLWRRLADAALWSRPWVRAGVEALQEEPALAVIIGNDIEGLAVAMRLQERYHKDARVIFDAHEYFLDLTSGGRESVRSIMRKRAIRRLAPRADAMTTVCEPLKVLYEKDLGVRCGVVFNATAQPVELSGAPPPWDGQRRLRLVHHGIAARDRELQRMVLAMKWAPQAELHFYLAGPDPEYVESLRNLGESAAPGRVFLHPPVKPSDLAATIMPYDLGLSLIYPSSQSLLNALPNKFFDCLNTGLGVITGPSPAMRNLIEAYGCGAVAESFEPEAVGRLLGTLTPAQVAAMRESAQQLAQLINYSTECRKVEELVRRLAEGAAAWE